MAHERFPEDERGHLRVRLIMQQMVQRMVIDPFLAARRVTVQLEWQGCQVSARMRTQAYTAVVCMAVNSFTVLPLVDGPNR